MVESLFGRILGYSLWIRKDQQGRLGGGVAVFLKKGVQVKKLEMETPSEALFLRVILVDSTVLLLCAMYSLRGKDLLHWVL